MSKNILQDISRMASSALSGAVGVKREINAAARSQIEEFMRSMNFVRREEFDVLHKMVLANRKQIETLLANQQVEAKSSSKSQESTKAFNTLAKKTPHSSKIKKIKPVPIDR